MSAMQADEGSPSKRQLTWLRDRWSVSVFLFLCSAEARGVIWADAGLEMHLEWMNWHSDSGIGRKWSAFITTPSALPLHLMSYAAQSRMSHIFAQSSGIIVH